MSFATGKDESNLAKIRDHYERFKNMCNSVFRVPPIMDLKVRTIELMDYSQYLVYRKDKWGLTLAGVREADKYMELIRNPLLELSIVNIARGLTLYSPILDVQEPEVLMSWKEAKDRGVLYGLYKSKDYLKMLSDQDTGDASLYTLGVDDYCEMIKNTRPKTEIVEAYIRFMQLNSRSVPYADIDYDDQMIDAYRKSEQQSEQYDFILRDKSKVVLPSDGVGLASCYCIMRGITYISWEPNPVGAIAVKLGIITHNAEVIEEDYEYVYFYCVQYYTVPYFVGHKYIVVDVPTVKKPGKKLAPEISSNVQVNVEGWTRISRTIPVMKLKQAKLLDITSKQLLISGGICDFEDDIEKARFVVVYNSVVFETLMDLGVFSGGYWHPYLRAKYARDIQQYVSKKKTHKEKNDVLPYPRYAKTRIKKDQEADYAFEEETGINVGEFVKIMRQKVVILVERTFPFREATIVKIGQIHVDQNDTIVRHYGEDRVYGDLRITSVNSSIMGFGVVTEYEYIYDSFFVRHTEVSAIKYIRLKKDHRYLFGDATIIRVYLCSTYRVRYYYVSIYVPENYKRPLIPVITESLVDDAI